MEAPWIEVAKAWEKCPECRPIDEDGRPLKHFSDHFFEWDCMYPIPCSKPEPHIHASLHDVILKRGWWVEPGPRGQFYIRKRIQDSADESGFAEIDVDVGPDPITAMARAINS